MATPNVGILTTAGKALIDKVNSGQAKISFSKVVFSSMDNSQLSDMQVKALTAIAPQEVVVSSPETTLDTNSGETRIRATGTNEKLADGVYVKTYGVFAKDDTGNEILYGVTVSPNPNYFPAYDGVTPQAVTYSYKTVIQETSNITMTNSNDVYASQEDLTEALQPYAKTVDVNQQLDKKVNIADMRKPANDVAGIEEVSTLQMQVNNSAVGTNLLTGTQDWQGEWENLPVWSVNKETYKGLTVLSNSSTWNGVGQYYDAKPNTTYTFSFYAKASEASNIMEIFTLDKEDYSNPVIRIPVYANQAITTEWQRYSVNFTTKSGGKIYPSVCINKYGATIYVAGYKLEKGNVATDWCPNPEDKVNVSDMRKPASDVAGIEEVNAKQDKIGYTPADDSKVVHTSDMRKAPSDVVGLEDVPQSVVKPELTYGVDLNTVLTPGVYPFKAISFTNYIDNSTYWGYLVVTSEGAIVTQTVYTTGPAQPLYRMWSGYPGSWSPWVRMANDYSVAHLSGANNFDTVPTVNNNPLLLANSLPSDLARTTKDANFTGKLQKSGIDVATKSDVTTAISTATANMVDSSKPTNFTAGLKSGGVDVATAADLKSVKDSAWRELTGSNDYLSYRFLYKINPDSKYLDISIGATVKKDINHDNGNILILDLATIISGISKIDSGFILGNGANGNISSISYTDTRIYMQVLYGRNFSTSDTITLSGKNATFAQIYYTELV